MGRNASSAPPMARNTGYGAPTRRAAAARMTAAMNNPSRYSSAAMLPDDPPPKGSAVEFVLHVAIKQNVTAPFVSMLRYQPEGQSHAANDSRRGVIALD